MDINQLLNWLDGGGAVTSSFTPERGILSLLLAFVLGQMLAWVYYATHSGLSYSRSYVQSLIVITVIVSLVMSTIANSFVTALGLMGALSIIRFRNMIKDTRDIAFIFCALVIGMATGAQRYAIAIVGALILCAILLYLHWTDFGAHQPHNGFLRFVLPSTMAEKHPVPGILKRFCTNLTLISVQDIGNGAHYAYQLMIRDANHNEAMLAELGRVDGLEQVSLTMQEQLLEV